MRPREQQRACALAATCAIPVLMTLPIWIAGSLCPPPPAPAVVWPHPWALLSALAPSSAPSTEPSASPPPTSPAAPSVAPRPVRSGAPLRLSVPPRSDIAIPRKGM
jgi:hypothetical protein